MLLWRSDRAGGTQRPLSTLAQARRRPDLRRLLLLAACLSCGACAIVTTHGKDPKPIAPDHYQVECYFNQFASQSDCDAVAERESLRWERLHGYSGHQVVQGGIVPGGWKYVYVVRFFRAPHANTGD